MAMSSYEIVRRAIDFDNPERLPVRFAALGIEETGRRFRGRICFESLCDIQHTLPLKGKEAIREETELLLEHWATPKGGFILSDYRNGQAIGVEAERKQIMLNAFLATDPWQKKNSPP